MQEFTKLPSMLLELLVIAAAVGAGVLVLLRVNRVFFKKLLKSDEKIYIRYLEKFVGGFIIMLGAFWVITSADITSSFGRMLFQGTTLLTAVAGLAAGPVIADVICGFMISLSKPFEIGDRIELSNGMAGIVQDITMRHTVLRGMDTAVLVVPNSTMNSLTVTNMSYQTQTRSMIFRFHVAYPTDVERAQEVIYKAIKDSKYSTTGKKGKMGYEYGPVYFMSYEESSLELVTTVYYSRKHATEAVKNDINLRVKKALDRNGIEIPYPYTNIIQHTPPVQAEAGKEEPDE